MDEEYKSTLAYITGVALGDGNLSSPGGRVTRLRITCDSKYPQIAEEIQERLRVLFPKNKVSIVIRKPSTCFDISVYSNRLDELLPWKVGKGTKIEQGAHVPNWILENDSYSKECLRGLIQTDGCIYNDRGYTMINFTNHISLLANNVQQMLTRLGFRSTLTVIKLREEKYKYVVRITRDIENVIRTLSLYKA